MVYVLPQGGRVIGETETEYEVLPLGLSRILPQSFVGALNVTLKQRNNYTNTFHFPSNLTKLNAVMPDLSLQCQLSNTCLGELTAFQTTSNSFSCKLNLTSSYCITE